jgi:dehydrogenase/reductase SDR family protein 4
MNFRIGFAIARRLAEDGASVMISSRKSSNVEEAVKEIRKNISSSAR